MGGGSNCRGPMVVRREYPSSHKSSKYTLGPTPGRQDGPDSTNGSVPAAPRQKLSRRVRARAFGGGGTDLKGTRNLLGRPPEALQRPRATSTTCLRTTRGITLDPVHGKVHPEFMGVEESNTSGSKVVGVWSETVKIMELLATGRGQRPAGGANVEGHVAAPTLLAHVRHAGLDAPHLAARVRARARTEHLDRVESEMLRPGPRPVTDGGRATGTAVWRYFPLCVCRRARYGTRETDRDT